MGLGLSLLASEMLVSNTALCVGYSVGLNKLSDLAGGSDSGSLVCYRETTRGAQNNQHDVHDGEVRYVYLVLSALAILLGN